jgi:enoyl-CoA hydratase/carnithine racemase
MDGTVTLNVEAGIAEITLRRPQKLNAITPAMTVEIGRICRAVDADADIRAVLVTGEGERAFCVGTDLNALASYDSLWAYRNRADYSGLFRSLRKPSVSALHGWVLGGGAEIALSTDMRVADTTTRIGFPEVKNGWVGGGAASQLLPRLVGYGQAMRLQLMGEPVSAEEALRIGLVEDLVPAGEGVARAREICARLATLRPLAVEAVKASVRMALSAPLEAGIHYENEMTTLCFAEGRHLDGIDAFKARKEGST